MKKIIFYLLCASILNADSLLEVCIMKAEEQGKIQTRIDKALKNISIANMKNKSNYQALKECIDVHLEAQSFISTVPSQCLGNIDPYRQHNRLGEGIRMVANVTYTTFVCYREAKCRQLDYKFSPHHDCDGREFYLDEEITNN